MPIAGETAGEIPRAFIVLRAHASSSELMRWLAEGVANYKLTRRVEITYRIPRVPFAQNPAPTARRARSQPPHRLS
jgi:hypothetical protein